MASFATLFNRVKPYLAVILLQFGFSGMSIISKFALDKGMSQHILVVYRHAIATALIAPFAIVLDRPVIDQNLYYTGMKYTSATFASAMCNVLPAFAFVMAWFFRLEKVNIRRLHSQAKVLGTTVTVGGAMLMTLLKGSILNLPWSKGGSNHQDSSSASAHTQDLIKGALMITAGCISWSGFIILQAFTLNSYPAELSLAALICLMGTVESSALALALEWKNPTAWSIHLDVKFLAALYSGVICSGIGYYVQGLVMKEKGPVFVSAFNPLSMVIVAILGSFFLAEAICIGRLIGAFVIVIGLYLVLWGKNKDETSSESDNNSVAPTAQERLNP
ncbi:WAT1-related protein [Quillaja saponaria]|uniref:WAT1-related protein n=1 Tax=Quillaja saponaria TaxID=32244 RepID=A0AAD7Q6L2_QUISA|nr:WAT1-related protein [Quillaja saponaria]